MPSISAVRVMKEAGENWRAGAGYVALHPSKGLFLGVDENRKAVFCPLADIVPSQPVPAFLVPNSIPEQACSDTAILECTLYRVSLTDRDDLTVRTDSFIEGTEIKALSDGIGAPV